jgi:hypothetical protein
VRQERWIAVAAGLAAAVTLVAPAGAAVTAAASDKVIFQAGVLTAADGVPSTWTSTKPKHTNTGAKSLKGIASCKQIAAADDLAQHGPHVDSPKFSDPAAPAGTTLAENTVYAFKTVKGAQQYLSAFEASSATTCLEQSVTKASGGKAHVTVTPLSSRQGVGVGYEANITVTDQTGNPVHVIDDLIFLRVGRALVTFGFSNKDVFLPQGPSIVGTVVSRLTSTANG